MEDKIFIGMGSHLSLEASRRAIRAGLMPAKENGLPGEHDATEFMKWYGVFTGALVEKAKEEQWPVTFQVFRTARRGSRVPDGELPRRPWG